MIWASKAVVAIGSAMVFVAPVLWLWAVWAPAEIATRLAATGVISFIVGLVVAVAAVDASSVAPVSSKDNT